MRFRLVCAVTAAGNDLKIVKLVSKLVSQFFPDLNHLFVSQEGICFWRQTRAVVIVKGQNL